MKLYTENDVKRAIDLAQNMDKVKYTEDDWQHTYSEKEILAALNPIELPSDDEINEAGKGHCTFLPSFVYGAQWMRDKIQGQPNPKPMPWIQPKDQMPEDSKPVLITDVEGMQIVAWYSASSDKWHSENHSWFTREIQCWMPIPEIV